MIALRLADGSFYPVITSSGTQKKRLVLTAASQDQEKVNIGIFSMSNAEDPSPLRMGSVFLEQLKLSDEGSIDIEFILEQNDDGLLVASAKDLGSGTVHSVSIDPSDSSISGDATDDLDVGDVDLQFADNLPSLDDIESDFDSMDFDSSSDSFEPDVDDDLANFDQDSTVESSEFANTPLENGYNDPFDEALGNQSDDTPARAQPNVAKTLAFTFLAVAGTLLGAFVMYTLLQNSQQPPIPNTDEISMVIHSLIG